MATTKSSSKADKKTSRCWPDYEPVPGKSEHEEGSCRKKPASRNGGKEPDRERSRQEQIALGGKRASQAKSKSPHAAERRSVSKTATKKSPAKTTSRKAAAKRPAASKKTANTSTRSVDAKSSGRAKKTSPEKAEA